MVEPGSCEPHVKVDLTLCHVKAGYVLEHLGLFDNLAALKV